jgi:hypothetical protein
LNKSFFGIRNAPPHEFDLAIAVFVEENNRLDRIGSNVLPRLKVDIFKTATDRKGVCDTLLIGTKTIASTHGCILFGDGACVPLNHGAVFLSGQLNPRKS